MSQYPELADVYTDKTGADAISSSDPNNAFDGIEKTQGLIGALGKPQTWSTTLITLLRRYRCNMGLELDGSTFYVRAGEAMLENTDATRYVMRRNSADVTLAVGNLDVGSIGVGTYYVYAKGGTAATTAPIIFSTDAYAPSAIGTAPYRRLGYFHNAIAGVLAATYVFNDMENNNNKGLNYITPAIVFSSSSPTSYTDLNLSPVVGSQRVVAILKCVNAAGSSINCAFRTNGETENNYRADYNDTKLIYINGEFATFQVLTDASGIVEWQTSAAVVSTVYVMGFIK